MAKQDESRRVRETSLNLDRYIRAKLKARHLFMLVALHDLHNVAKVAASLNITQPAVSKSLAELERGLGVKLFERTSRGVHPTVYGTCLVQHARTVLNELTHGRDELGRLITQSAGTVSIGASSTAVYAFLPQSLVLLKRRSPSTSVLVREGSLKGLLDSLWSGELDLIVGRLPQEHPVPGLKELILSEDKFALIAGPNHPLVGRKPLQWADLKEFPWVLPPAGTLLRSHVEHAFQQYGLPMPVSAIETVSVHLRCSYLSISTALSFQGSYLSRDYEHLGLLAMLPLELPTLSRPVGVTWDGQRHLSPSTKLMIKCLEEVGRTQKSARAMNRPRRVSFSRR